MASRIPTCAKDGQHGFSGNIYLRFTFYNGPTLLMKRAFEVKAENTKFKASY